MAKIVRDIASRPSPFMGRKTWLFRHLTAVAISICITTSIRSADATDVLKSPDVTDPIATRTSSSSLVRLKASVVAVSGEAMQEQDFSIFEALPGKPPPPKPLLLEFPMKLRNYGRYQQLALTGARITPAQMEEFYPSVSDYEKVVAWVKTNFTNVQTDKHRMTVYATATIPKIRSILHVSFVKVIEPDHHIVFTANSPPEVPQEIADRIIGINGLQPHIQVHPHSLPAVIPSTVPPFYPAHILKAYGADTLKVDGSGQTIGIISPDARTVDPSDLTNFWSKTGVSRQITDIDMPAYRSGDATSTEATIDVEWASAIAPNARIKLYTTSFLPAAFDTTASTSVEIFSALIRAVADDTDNQPHMGQIAISYGFTENCPPALIETIAINLRRIAGAGITIFVASGDGGSSPLPNGDPGGTTPVVEYPASDTNVVSIGGTTLLAGAPDWAPQEAVWSGSGGGVSTQILRPPWQKAIGVQSTFRLVPDVAMVADPGTRPFAICDGATLAEGGTSFGPPIWAGLWALLNQARAARNPGTTVSSYGLGPASALLYPLAGPGAFHEISNGTNGAYSGGSPYNQCTGLGTPRFDQIFMRLVR